MATYTTMVQVPEAVRKFFDLLTEVGYVGPYNATRETVEFKIDAEDDFELGVQIDDLTEAIGAYFMEVVNIPRPQRQD